jgi:hypothetical protein
MKARRQRQSDRHFVLFKLRYGMINRKTIRSRILRMPATLGKRSGAAVTMDESIAREN